MNHLVFGKTKYCLSVAWDIEPCTAYTLGSPRPPCMQYSLHLDAQMPNQHKAGRRKYIISLAQLAGMLGYLAIYHFS
jgi:hypothetical protein